MRTRLIANKTQISNRKIYYKLLFYYVIIFTVTTTIIKVLEKYECHPLYKFCKELDHPGFDSRRDQATFLFTKTSSPSLRATRPLSEWVKVFYPWN